MTQLLMIGFLKAIRGKSLSKNKPTCENARCIGAVWKLDPPGYGLLTIGNSCFVFRVWETAVKGLPISCCFAFSLNSLKLVFAVPPRNLLFAVLIQENGNYKITVNMLVKKRQRFKVSPKWRAVVTITKPASYVLYILILIKIVYNMIAISKR